jgi:hypothetical protein
VSPADLIAQADALLSSRQGRGVLSMADQYMPTRYTLRYDLMCAFERARHGGPSERRKARLALLGPTKPEEIQERRDREEASRCPKCGVAPGMACPIADEGGACVRRSA